MKTPEQARLDLLSVLHHLRLAMEDATAQAGPDGTVGLAIIAMHPDGSGTIAARLEARDFVQDLTLALGGQEPTKDEMLDAKAAQFLDKHGL